VGSNALYNSVWPWPWPWPTIGKRNGRRQTPQRIAFFRSAQLGNRRPARQCAAWGRYAKRDSSGDGLQCNDATFKEASVTSPGLVSGKEEGQDEWAGKRGVSLHVKAVVTKEYAKHPVTPAWRKASVAWGVAGEKDLG
jgi:hypothetical protein